MNKKIACVTGASGLIGKRIVTKLVSTGIDVRVLCHSKPNTTPGVECFQGDLTDIQSLHDFLKDADYLFHCAAELRDESKMQMVNVEGTANLLQVASTGHLQYYCHMSSAGVIGYSSLKLIDENSPCSPQNEYERTKHESELLAKNKIPDCTTVILRPINVMDEERPDVFGLPLRHSFKDKLHVFIKGKECAHQVHAEHVANSAVFFMNKKLENPEIFFVGNDEDDNNTYQGIWNLFSQLSSDNTIKPIKYTLPLWFPHLLRRLRGIKANSGSVKYSSSKLAAQGVTNLWSMMKTTQAILETHGKQREN